MKVFPVTSPGGPDYIKAITAPLPQILLNSTGGIDLDNARAFIEAGAAVVSAGSSLVSSKAVAEGKYSIISDCAKKFKEEVHKGRVG